MAGAIDLFAGTTPIAGPNLFQVDKDPLKQLDEGIQGIIGQQGGSTAQQILNGLQGIINSILGFGLDFLTGNVGGELGDLTQLATNFENLLKLLANPNLLDPNFLTNILTYAENFIQDILKPTNLVALLVSDATHSAGVTGFVPLENLALELITGGVESVQALIDAILATVGFPAGSGTVTNVNAYFADLLEILANPALTSGTFNPVTAVENFITAMINPTNLLAPMVNVGGSYVVSALHVGVLDAAKITSGTFADSFVPGLANLQNTIIGSQGGSGTGLAGVTTALQNIVINNVNGLTGYLTHLSPAGVLALVGLAPGALPAGITMAGAQLTGAVAAAIVSGALTSATIAGSAITSIVNQANIPALTTAWTGTLDGSKIVGSITAAIITGVLNQAQIPSLTSAWTGTIDGSVLRNAITTATLAGSQLSSAITNQNYIPTLTSAWTNTIDGALLRNAITTATLAGSQLSSAITNQAYIPALTSAWGKTIDGSLLAGTIATAVAPWAAPIDTLMNAWGVAATGNTAAQLQSLAATIPSGNVAGNLGGISIGNDLQQLVDAGVQAINNNSTINNGIGLFAGALDQAMNFMGYAPSGIPQPGSLSAFISNTSVNNDLKHGIDPTTNGPFDLSKVMDSASLPVVAVTQTGSIMCFDQCPDGGVKQSIRWLGYPTGGTFGTITSFYVNVYKLNTSTGVSTLVYASPNIVGSVAAGSSPVWNSLNLPSASYFTANQGDIYAVEIAIVGAGTYNVAGLTTNSLPNHPSAIPAKYGATRGVTLATFGSVGAGGVQGNTTAINFNYSHNIVGNCLIVGVTQYCTGSGAPTVKVGATTLTQIGGTFPIVAGSQYGYWFGMMNPPTGAQTINVTINSTVASFVASGSVSYQNVGSIGATAGVTGSSTAASQAVTGAANSVIVQMFGGNSTTFSAYNQNSRYNVASVNNVNIATLIGDNLSGAASVTFSATATPSAAWGGTSVLLNGAAWPAPATFANPAGASVVAYSNSTPWIGIAGTPGQTVYPPVTLTYLASQSGITNPAVTYPWANWFDVTASGAGAGGDAGGPLQGSLGGAAGAWATATLSKATMGSANINVTIGAAGVGGPSTSAGGGNGGGSSATIGGTTYASAAGGTGRGSAAASGDPNFRAGTSQSQYTVTDHYGTQYNYPGAFGGATAQGFGQQPGAGGAGGNSLSTGHNQFGGNGGPGIVYIRCYA